MNLTTENVIKTKLIGSQVQMHSLLIFLSLLGGIGIFGLLGLLYGPLIVALAMTFVELYERRYRIDLTAPASTADAGPHHGS
jgi:predicted PurR-regulated permease PerM